MHNYRMASTLRFSSRRMALHYEPGCMRNDGCIDGIKVMRTTPGSSCGTPGVQGMAEGRLPARQALHSRIMVNRTSAVVLGLKQPANQVGASVVRCFVENRNVGLKKRVGATPNPKSSKEPKHKGQSSKIPGKTKAEVVAGCTVPVTVTRPKELRAAEPRTAANHPALAIDLLGFQPRRAIHRRASIITMPAVRRPFQDIA